MSLKNIDELKKIGIITQKQKDLFTVRIKTVAGDLTSEQLQTIATIAKKYSDGNVHLSTRQGVEIHNIPSDKIEDVKTELAEGGVILGACGPRGRGIVACPGAATCKFGIIETKELAKDLDSLYFRKEAPGKFKIAVSGCPNNCSKPIENDVGVMGGVLPCWNKEKCIDCGLCEKVCPTGAIVKTASGYELILDKCILCGICINNCPTSAWEEKRRGFTLWLGGTMGKKPRLGTKAKVLIETKEELLKYVARAFEFYKRYGRKKERFGHTLDRIGLEKALKEILDDK